jgi:hypothetical protein
LRDRERAQGLKGHPLRERHFRLEAGCVGALSVLLIEPEARKYLEDVYVSTTGGDRDEMGNAVNEEDRLLSGGVDDDAEQTSEASAVAAWALAPKMVKSARLERLNTMPEQLKRCTGYMLLSRLACSATVGVLPGYEHTAVTAMHALINTLARGPLERRMFHLAGGLQHLTLLLTHGSGEVQRCATVALSMFADQVGVARALEGRAPEVVGREAKPVLLLMLHMLRQKVHSLAGVRRNHWDVVRLLKV